MAFNISYVFVAKDRFTSVANRVNKAARRVEVRMRFLRRQTARVSKEFGGLQGVMTKFAAVAVSLLIFAAPIKQAIEFESALSNLNKVMDFDLPGGLDRTGEALQDLSRRIPIITTGLVEIATAGGQLGVAKKDILVFTESVGKISIALDLLPGETAKSLAKLSNIFKIPITEMESFADSINLLTNTSIAEAIDIFTALANKAAAAGQSMGLTARETLALSTAFIETGVNAGRVGSIMDSMARRLTNVNVLGKNFVEAFVKNPRKELIALLRQLNKLKGAQKTQTFNDIFAEFGIRVESLADTMDTILIPTLKKATNIQAAAGSIQKEFAIRLDTTKSKLIILGNEFNIVSEGIGSGFLPAVNAIASVLGFLSDVIATVIEVTGPLIPMLVAAAGAFALVKLVTLAWAAAQIVLNIAMSANPIGFIVAGILAAIVAITFIIKKIEELGSVSNVFKAIGQSIIDFMILPLRIVAKTIDAIAGTKLEAKLTEFFQIEALKIEPPTAAGTQDTKTQIDINLNAPPGIIQSTEAKTTGPGRINIGQNMAGAT